MINKYGNLEVKCPHCGAVVYVDPLMVMAENYKNCLECGGTILIEFKYIKSFKVSKVVLEECSEWLDI